MSRMIPASFSTACGGMGGATRDLTTLARGFARPHWSSRFTLPPPLPPRSRQGRALRRCGKQAEGRRARASAMVVEGS